MTIPALLSNISDTDYHADRDSLSSSGARKLLPPSCPALFRYEQDNPPKSTVAFDIGKAAHTLILGAGQELRRIDADNWMTKAAKEKRQLAYDDGVIPLLKADFDAAYMMANAVQSHPLVAALFADGIAEQSGYWYDEPTDVKLRFRPDWITTLANGRTMVVDLKTSQSANPQEFSASAARYGYAMQAAWYCEGIRALGIDDDPGFLFVIVDKNPPHLVSVVALDDDAIAYGQRQMRRAIDIFAKCQENNDWPGYSDEVHIVGLPRWAYTQEGALE